MWRRRLRTRSQEETESSEGDRFFTGERESNKTVKVDIESESVTM